MLRIILTILVSTFATQVFPQLLTSSSIFAHNDYVKPIPFHNAYQNGVGFIEADIFLRDGKLLVAHTRLELDNKKTLDTLYLKPLQQVIVSNNGKVYPDDRKLTLMLDLKTEGDAALKTLIKKLESFPQLMNCNSLTIAVSGNMPPPLSWNNYPLFIHFDGRPGINYTPEQLQRVVMISDHFKKYAGWNGKGVLTEKERTAVTEVIKKAHQLGKPVRFWDIPDFTNAWIKLNELQVDIINSDHVDELARFVRDFNKNTFVNPATHSVYVPPPSVTYKSRIPKNVILMIGDGTGLAQLYSGYTANHGKLSLFGIKSIGLSITYSADSYITDSASGATAMSTGRKTNNRFIGVDSLKKPLPLIPEQLKAKDFKIGIISNGDITDATPASFYAHQPDRGMSEAIALDFLATKTDVLIGGGIRSFITRKDGRNLMTELKSKGYSVADRFTAIDTVKHHKLVLLDDSAVVSKQKGRGDFLSRSLAKTTTLLSGKSGFFIMMEGAQIDHGGHDNNLPYVVTEMLDFDQAIGEAMKFVDSNGETLLIVTADHETGGLSLLNGNIAAGSLFGNFSSTDHSAIPVPVFAYGPGAEVFQGVYQNTEIYHKLIRILLSGKK